MKDTALIVAGSVMIVNVVVFVLSWLLLRQITAISKWWEQECIRMEMECTKRNW